MPRPPRQPPPPPVDVPQEKGARFEMLKKGLPHLYERKWYPWAWEFFKSKNPTNLLCAANQISKSSTQIRKCIEWAGNPKLWEGLWPGKCPPRVFWYLYPDKDTVKAELENKWIPEFLPRDAYKDHPTYGWKIVSGKQAKEVDYIAFNSGVKVYFKTYTQDITRLQSGTVYAIFCDEELPEEFYSEMQARLFATAGYFSMVFTATRNQQMWKRAMEGDGDAELFPDAFKLQVSMYDCLTYKDGTPGAFTSARIEQIKRGCKSATEVLRRVFGRFVTEVGRKYGAFDPARHFVAPFHIPPDWHRYTGVDPGSGGVNHSPAICFIAVRPDNRYGVVYRGWKGDDGPTYTNGDVFNKYLEMRHPAEIVVRQHYDQAAKDFHTLSQRAGETFEPSDKSHERGEDTINTLFKNDMLALFAGDPELEKLGGELSSLMKGTAKRHADDDMADAMRYPVVSIPWDWSVLQHKKTDAEKKAEQIRPYTDLERVAMEIAERRGEEWDDGREQSEGWHDLEDEFDEWNDAYGT